VAVIYPLRRDRKVKKPDFKTEMKQIRERTIGPKTDWNELLS